MTILACPAPPMKLCSTDSQCRTRPPTRGSVHEVAGTMQVDRMSSDNSGCWPILDNGLDRSVSISRQVQSWALKSVIHGPRRTSNFSLVLTKGPVLRAPLFPDRGLFPGQWASSPAETEDCLTPRSIGRSAQRALDTSHSRLNRGASGSSRE